MNKGFLWQCHIDYSSMNKSIVNLRAIKSSINDFYKEYGERIKTIASTIQNFQKEYFEFAEDGQTIKTEVISITQPQPEITRENKIAEYLPDFLNKLFRMKKYVPVPDKKETRQVMKPGKTLEEFKNKLNDYLAEDIITSERPKIVTLN